MNIVCTLSTSKQPKYISPNTMMPLVVLVLTNTVSFSEQSSRRIDSSYGSTVLIPSLRLIVYNRCNNFHIVHGQQTSSFSKLCMHNINLLIFLMFLFNKLFSTFSTAKARQVFISQTPFVESAQPTVFKHMKQKF